MYLKQARDLVFSHEVDSTDRADLPRAETDQGKRYPWEKR